MLTTKCISDFLFDRKSKRLSPKSISYYQGELGYFSKWLIENHGDIEIENITSTIIKKWFVKLGETRNKGGVSCSFRAIRAMLLWAEQEYEIEWKTNPIKKVSLPSGKIEPLDPIPLENVKKLIDSCYGMFQLRNQVLLKFMIDGGFRASEVLDLRISDVDISGQVIIRSGKGSKRKIVFIGKNTMKTYQQYLATKENIDPEDYVFINERKGKLNYYGLYQVITRQCKRAKIPNYPLHSFRRTNAITLFRKGVDLLTISRLLGHQGIEVTRRYLALTNSDLEKSYKSPIDGLLD